MAKGIKTGGRQKGSGNVLTRDVKEAVIDAFHQLGGVSYLVTLGNEEPRTFAGLLKGVLPLALTHSGSLTISRPDDDEIIKAYQQQEAARANSQVKH